jgi:hypothetical protein
MSSSSTDKKPAEGDVPKKRESAKSVSYQFQDPHIRAKSRSNGEPIIRFKTGFRTTIFDAMKNRGWKQTGTFFFLFHVCHHCKLLDADMDWDFHWFECIFILIGHLMPP